ncbi:MAG TPA: YicC/YloC family endoribonuclease [Burkholderiales bacterium]|nr:YicC/YloC family endoribonuclease [Burkholderiales bacterium]
MIYSMTGYAIATTELPSGALNLELRSVNHRYLDIQFRIPDELRPLEAGLREKATARIGRGKVEVRIATGKPAASQSSLQLDEALLARLAALDARIRQSLPDAQPLASADVLRWPGMLGNDSIAAEALQDACGRLLDRALDELTASRAREGEKLKALLLERIASMETLIARLAPRMPQLVSGYRERLTARLREAMVNADEERLKQELVLFASKIDVDEELSRLGTHFGEIRRILDKGGAVGKRLDFLMQELNREANTLGSKSVDMEFTQTSMELKVLIEQMREQIQNIE